MAFRIKDTLEANLKAAALDESGNLIYGGIVIIKQLSKNEVYEHLGYFYDIAKELKLPYNQLLETFKQHHKKLREKSKCAKK